MTTLSELTLYLETSLNLPPITDYCPNGLQVEGRQSINKIATAVTASLKTIETAVREKVDALIVHHGLFWRNDSYVISGSKREKLKLLIENEISLFCYHLPLDKHLSIGNNWKAARDMGWTDLEGFGFYNGTTIGVKGKIPPQSRESFKELLECYYLHSATSALGGKEEIHTVALISGGAHKCIEEAVQQKVDAFITGSFDEPTWHQAYESGINFYAMGHSATERVGPIALSRHLSENLKVQSLFIEDFNPF